jgi:hypothetical protein
MRYETTPDILVAQAAREQHGVVSLAQLAAAGLDRDAVQRRVRAGRLHRLHRSVYAVGHTRLTREGRWLAAVLACGVGALLSHRSAAALWELRPIPTGRIDVTVPRASGYRSNAAIVVHRPVAPRERAGKDGIPVTTPTQTLIDLSAMLPRPALERAIEAAERLRLLDVARLPPRLREIAGTVETATRSGLEVRFLALCNDHGLPRPLVNTMIEGYEVDCCWPAARVIVEVDTHRYHGTRAAFERDRERDAILTAAGWRVVRVTDRRLAEPATVAALLARVIRGP